MSLSASAAEYRPRQSTGPPRASTDPTPSSIRPASASSQPSSGGTSTFRVSAQARPFHPPGGQASGRGPNPVPVSAPSPAAPPSSSAVVAVPTAAAVPPPRFPGTSGPSAPMHAAAGMARAGGGFAQPPPPSAAAGARGPLTGGSRPPMTGGPPQYPPQQQYPGGPAAAAGAGGAGHHFRAGSSRGGRGRGVGRFHPPGVNPPPGSGYPQMPPGGFHPRRMPSPMAPVGPVGEESAPTNPAAAMKSAPFRIRTDMKMSDFNPATAFAGQDGHQYHDPAAEQFAMLQATANFGDITLPYFRPTDSFFASAPVRDKAAHTQQILQARLNPSDPAFVELPATLQQGRYHSLMPIPSDSQSGVTTPVRLYKTTSSADGLCYLVRRFSSGARLSDDFARAAIEPWLHFQRQGRRGSHPAHPNIIAIRDAFVTHDFGDSSMCFVYDFFPGASSVSTSFLLPTADPIDDESLWSLVMQILSAMVSVHAAGLSCTKMVHVDRILVTDRNRFRLNCCGFFDVFEPRGSKPLADQQYDDLVALGRTILVLMTKQQQSAEQLTPHLEAGLERFSTEFRPLLFTLLQGQHPAFPATGPTPPARPSVFAVLQSLSHRLLLENQRALSHVDYLEGELLKEAHSGRLFRLLLKLGFVTDRTEFQGQQAWSETGDRYLLGLFRDYLFQQQTPEGVPVVDMGHVVDSLLKLDVGAPEKIMLVSRDEENILVTGYDELRRITSDAFLEVSQAAVTAREAAAAAAAASGAAGGGGDVDGDLMEGL